LWCGRIAAVHHIASRKSCVGEVDSQSGGRELGTISAKDVTLALRPNENLLPARAVWADNRDKKLRETSLPADPDAAEVGARRRLYLDVTRAAGPARVSVGIGAARERGLKEPIHCRRCALDWSRRKGRGDRDAAQEAESKHTSESKFVQHRFTPIVRSARQHYSIGRYSEQPSLAYYITNHPAALADQVTRRTHKAGSFCDPCNNCAF